jgi:hypothetical protein
MGRIFSIKTKKMDMSDIEKKSIKRMDLRDVSFSYSISIFLQNGKTRERP